MYPKEYFLTRMEKWKYRSWNLAAKKGDTFVFQQYPYVVKFVVFFFNLSPQDEILELCFLCSLAFEGQCKAVLCFSRGIVYCIFWLFSSISYYYIYLWSFLASFRKLIKCVRGDVCRAQYTTTAAYGAGSKLVKFCSCFCILDFVRRIAGCSLL